MIMVNERTKQGPCGPVPNRSTSLYCVIDSARIHFLSSTLEAYEGLAVTTTLDPLLGLVRLQIAPGCEQDVRRILHAEASYLDLRMVSAEPPGSASQHL